MSPIVGKSMSTSSFRALGQMQVKLQTFEKAENKRQMYGSQVWVNWLPYICLLFSGFWNVCHFTCIWCRALKLGCITINVDILFLTMGFICLFYDNKFMLISGSHISNRSISIPFLSDLFRSECSSKSCRYSYTSRFVSFLYELLINVSGQFARLANNIHSTSCYS